MKVTKDKYLDFFFYNRFVRRLSWSKKRSSSKSESNYKNQFRNHSMNMLPLSKQQRQF